MAEVVSIFQAAWEGESFRCSLSMNGRSEGWSSENIRLVFSTLTQKLSEVDPCPTPNRSGFLDTRPVYVDLGSLPIDRMGVAEISIRLWRERWDLRDYQISIKSGGGADAHSFEWSQWCFTLGGSISGLSNILTYAADKIKDLSRRAPHPH